MSGLEDLFNEAAENAGQDTVIDESWGAELKLAENERWAGKYRGEDVTSFSGDDRRIHLLDEFDGAPMFIRGRTKLDRQFDKEMPSPGDTIAIIRLDDIALDSGNTMHDYGVAKWQGGDAPTPAETSPPTPAPAADGIPF